MNFEGMQDIQTIASTMGNKISFDTLGVVTNWGLSYVILKPNKTPKLAEIYYTVYLYKIVASAN